MADSRDVVPRRERGSGGKFWMYACGVLALLLAGVVIWKSLAESRMRKEQAQVREALTAQAAATLETKTENLLRLAAMSLSFAARDGILKNDYGQIRQYLSLLIREKNIEGAAIADAEGKITAATDEKMETQEGRGLFPAAAFEGTEVVVIRLDEGRTLAAAPVMAFTGRTGSVLVVYRSEPFVPKQ